MKDTHKLVYKGSGEEVLVGAELYDHSDTDSTEAWVVTGWRGPQHSNSSGRVFVRPKGEVCGEREFFPHVFGLAVVPVNATAWRVTFGEPIKSHIKMAPLNFIPVTKERLEEEGHLNPHFHVNSECWRSYGPRGGENLAFEEWRAAGRLKTWKTRPTDFRLPVKHGLKLYAQLTPREVGSVHFADECPCNNLPSTRGSLLALLEFQGVYPDDIGTHTILLDLTRSPVLDNVTEKEEVAQ